MKLTYKQFTTAMRSIVARYDTAHKKMTKQVGVLCVAAVICLAAYALGFEILLSLFMVFAIAVYIPMPKVFDSWLSRALVAVVMLYGVLQISAAFQFLLSPHSRFGALATIATVLVIVLVVAFGQPRTMRSFAFGSRKDLWAAIGCLFFLLPFIATMHGKDSTVYISRVADSQVVDSIAHYNNIVKFTTTQNLAYQKAGYYPAGFHIVTSFLEHTALGDIRELPWTTQAKAYFLEYIISALLLSYLFVYFIFGLVGFLKVTINTPALAAIALSGGGGITLMSLLLFMEDGFLNYYYICATLLLGVLYLLETKTALSRTTTWDDYSWNVTAFLLLGAGASLSWPLFAPIVVLSAACLVLPTFGQSAWRTWRFVGLHVPIALAAGVNTLAFYFQTTYGGNNSQLLNTPGALHNFNVLFLVVGFFALATLVYSPNLRSKQSRLLSAFLPYVLLILGLMLLQYFRLGSAQYYLIKSGLLLEIFFLAVMIAAGVYYCNRLTGLTTGSLSFLVVLIGTVSIGTIALLPQPLQEVRTLFRNQSHIGTPPYLNEDAAAVAALGAQNKLQNQNMTILHYDQAGQRLFAQVEIASWANNLDKVSFSSQALGTSECFGRQFGDLAYGLGESAQQDLIYNVRKCIDVATRPKGTYYIITDRQSLANLRQLFGDRPKYVVE